MLFVSHNMGAVTSLCPTAIWLDGGSIHKRGVAREVIMEYLSDSKVGSGAGGEIGRCPQKSVGGRRPASPEVYRMALRPAVASRRAD